MWKEEQRLNREANILIAQEVASSLRANADVATEAIKLANKFIDSFQVDSLPEHRVVRNEDEIAEYMQAYGMKKEDFDSEEDPFKPLF